MNVSMDVCVPLPEVALHQLLVLLRIVSAQHEVVLRS
jgi:hypothetical protein